MITAKDHLHYFRTKKDDHIRVTLKRVLIKLSNKEEIIMTTQRKSRLGKLARLSVFFLTAGFIFPHVMTEDADNDIAKHDADGDVKVKKQ